MRAKARPARRYRFGWIRTRPGGEYRIRELFQCGDVTVAHKGRSFSLPVYDGRTLAHAKTERDAEYLCRLLNAQPQRKGTR